MHITYINSDYPKIRGYAPGFALGRRGVSWVSQWWLRDLLLHENLLLVLLDDLLELMIVGGHNIYQLVLYVHVMMMQHLAFKQKQLLN